MCGFDPWLWGGCQRPTLLKFFLAPSLYRDTFNFVFSIPGFSWGCFQRWRFFSLIKKRVFEKCHIFCPYSFVIAVFSFHDGKHQNALPLSVHVVLHTILHTFGDVSVFDSQTQRPVNPCFKWWGGVASAKSHPLLDWRGVRPPPHTCRHAIGQPCAPPMIHGKKG